MTATGNSATPVSPERTRVGFVGIGNMGTPMAGHLVKAGWRVSVYDIDPKVMLDIVNASTGRNNSTENKFAQFIFNKKFNSGFALGLMAKDLALAMEVAKAVDVEAEMGQACLHLWQEAERSLGGGADHTEIVRHLGEH